MTDTWRIPVRCGRCGYGWQSATRSGRTTCPRCDERIYVPAAQRRRASGGEPVTRRWR